MERLQAFAKSLHDPFLVRCLHCLLRGPLCLCDLQSALRASPNYVRDTAERLRSAGLVELTTGPYETIFCSIRREHRRTIEAVFDDYDDETLSAPKLITDLERLEMQLASRQDGICTVRLSPKE